ncbi:testis-expressed protein 10 [Aricia agestis]|uniref:testis-expressed protein 10 n=1 Tax=Aricia agestis TaxID=91739 RepID=UPI001C209A5F|nr:testis-expressed protein 10 [Aricia agestis]
MHKTGATRYQKFLKAEKSKTKLKGKKDKELPKGTNVTKTNFKVKKIIIREQLKKHESTDVLSTRKLNVKELLSRLNHFNTNVRVDALDGIKELISSHPEVLLQNLGQLINGVTALTLNVEKNVRQSALKVLHLVLSNISQENIEPFFDVMSTYLRNAMTHIDSRIQEDSLLFLDILLLCTPTKLAEDFNKIIPNFLDMISKLRSDQPGRTLTVNMNSQITSVKWRGKVFQRLRDLMQKFAEYNNINQEISMAANTHYFKDNNPMNYYPLFDKTYIANCYISCFSSKNSEISLVTDDIERFREYIDILFPLLFETWVEMCPNKKSETNFEMVVGEDSALLLKHILEIIFLTWNFVKHFNKKNSASNIGSIFSQKYRNSFSQHFVNSFPYATVIRSKQGKSDEETVLDPKLVEENLKICQLFIQFNPNVDKKHQGKEISAVLGYIEKIFGQNINDYIDDVVINILLSLFSIESVGWSKTLLVLDALFRKIIWVYFNKAITNSYKQKIFGLLCKIALNDKLSHFHSSEAFEMWLKHLPDILLSESVNNDTINIIHRFAATNNNVFNTVVKPKLLSIIENLPKISISDSEDDIAYHKLLSTFYWIKTWDKDSLNLLENQLLNNVYKGDSGKYIFDTLRLRSGIHV